jgi:rhodanese-related sulfurtransferase
VVKPEVLPKVPTPAPAVPPAAEPSPEQSAAAVNDAVKEASATLDTFLKTVTGKSAEASTQIKNLLYAVQHAPQTAQAKADAVLALYHAQMQAIYDGIPPILLPLFPEDPNVLAASGAAAFLGATVVLPYLTIYNLRFGGYAGNLSAEDMQELLRNSSALLVDIRAEAELEESGVPDLRRSARGKAISTPPERLEPSVRRRTKRPVQAEKMLQAMTIASLRRVRRARDVIVMDSNGSQAKAMARLLREKGIRRPYILEGGYKGWVDQGLGTQAAYSVSASEAIKQDLEQMSQEDDNLLGRVNQFLSTDEGKIYVATGVGLSALVLANLKLVLEAAAVVGAAKLGVDAITDRSYARPRVGPGPRPPPPPPPKTGLAKIQEDAQNLVRQAQELQASIVSNYGKLQLMMLREQWAIPAGDAYKQYEDATPAEAAVEAEAPAHEPMEVPARAEEEAGIEAVEAGTAAVEAEADAAPAEDEETEAAAECEEKEPHEVEVY